MTIKQFIARLLLVVFFPVVLFPLGLLAALLTVPGLIVLMVIKWILYCANVKTEWKLPDVWFKNTLEKVIDLGLWYIGICDGDY